MKEIYLINFYREIKLKKFFLIAILFLGLNLSAFAGVDINTASQADLETVKGLGPAKAKAIIEYREEHGAFKSVTDLTNVRGIGSGTLKQLGDQVSIQENVASEEAKTH